MPDGRLLGALIITAQAGANRTNYPRWRPKLRDLWQACGIAAKQGANVAGVTNEIVPEALAGQRVDNFLIRHLKGVPKTHIYRLLRRGEVRVNGGRVKPTQRLNPGDRVRIPPVRLAQRDTMPPSQAVMERLENAILLETDRLLIINKPSGLAVHGGSGIAYGVIEALRQMRPKAAFLDLAHRIDRDTSGCLVVAKRRSTLRALHSLFREGAVDKQYLVLVHGDIGAQVRRVNAALNVVSAKGGERSMQVDRQGQKAQTDFTALERGAGWTLARANLYTGRMHQIRAHAQHIGHPVVMDNRYGHADADQAFRQLGLRRLFLHAESIGFDTESTGPVHMNAPLPDDLEAVLTRLRQPSKTQPEINDAR